VHLSCGEKSITNADWFSRLVKLQDRVSQNDLNFLSHVAWQDYLFFLDKINDQIKKEYPSTPSSSLFVDLNYYSAFPASANVRLASNFPFEMNPNLKPNVETLFRRAREETKPAIVLRMAFRDGYAIHEMTWVMLAPHIAAAELTDQESRV
jgi:hypothetical protein